MANDAEDYIAAVADACHAAGLHVADYWSDDIDPRDGAITLTLTPEADPESDEDWQLSRTLGWDEEKGWFIGEPKNHHGELHNLLWLASGALPEPAEVAEAARRVVAGEADQRERYHLMQHTYWRSQEDDERVRGAARRVPGPGERHGRTGFSQTTGLGQWPQHFSVPAP
jgi:hypothetical protein